MWLISKTVKQQNIFLIYVTQPYTKHYRSFQHCYMVFSMAHIAGNTRVKINIHTTHYKQHFSFFILSSKPMTKCWRFVLFRKAKSSSSEISRIFALSGVSQPLPKPISWNLCSNFKYGDRSIMSSTLLVNILCWWQIFQRSIS